jgi:hypothetical protein
MILCECGEFIDGDIFRDYIKTSACPSSSTIGHKKCGRIFNFIDEKMPRKYSSRIELKILAMRFARMNLEDEIIGKFMVEVDRLKSDGNLSDHHILLKALIRFEK